MKGLKKSESPGGTGLSQNVNTKNKRLDFEYVLAFTQPQASYIGWRGALAEGQGQFRKYGAYDYVPSGREFRRRLARMTKRGAR